MNLEDITLREMFQSQKRQILSDSASVRFLKDSEREKVRGSCPGLEGTGRRLCSSYLESSFPFCKMRRLWKVVMHCGSTRWMYLTTLHTSKWWRWKILCQSTTSPHFLKKYIRATDRAMRALSEFLGGLGVRILEGWNSRDSRRGSCKVVPSEKAGGVGGWVGWVNLLSVSHSHCLAEDMATCTS